MKLKSYLLAGVLLGAVQVNAQITSIQHSVETVEEHDHDHDHVQHDPLNLDQYKDLLKGFDLAAANAKFDSMGSLEEDRFGYINFLKMEYLTKTYPEIFRNKKKDETPIPMKNANCPNAGFEDLVFNPQWTGGIATVTTAYNNTTIVSNGFNAAYNDNQSRHTILTAPPVNNNPINGAIVGYDPVAINPATGIAEIPFIAPGGNGSSVRLGNAASGYQRERLTYVINVTPTNKSFYYQFAVVLQNPATHAFNEQPYFKIQFLDSTGALVGGSCGEFNVVSSQAVTDTSFKQAQGGSSAIYYRPWDRVDVDLTQYVGQQITVQFETADCGQGGHYGYAYVDAGCQESIDLQANYCDSDPYAILVAPPGFPSYQWYGPNSPTLEIVGATNDSLTVMAPQVGDTFYCSVETPNGCILFQQLVLGETSLNIENIVTEGTCFGASVGSVQITASGSPQGYFYDFQPINVTNSTGELDSLGAGNYMVHVWSPNPLCGTVDTSFVITVPPVYPSNVVAKFCDGVGEVVAPQSANYQWYDNNQVAIPAPVGTSQTIIDTTAYLGEKYYLVYQLASGCYDSLIYTFYDNRVNSSAIITRPAGCRSIKIDFDDQSPNSDTLTFSVNGPNGYQVIWNDTAFVNFQDNGLDTGLYYVSFVDEGCHYDTTFRILNEVSDSVKNFIFCPTDQFFLSSIANGSHQWTDPLGNIIGTNQNITISNIIEGTYIDSCEVTPGCFALSTYNMDSITIVTDFNVDDNFCYGGSDGVIYMQYVDGPPGNTTFTATGPNGIVVSGDTLVGLPAGTYIVQTEVLTCTHTDTIKVGEPPLSGDTLTIYTEICDELEAVTLQAPPGYTNYQWYYKGQPVPDAFGPSFGVPYPQLLTNYYVTYSVPPLGCTKQTIKFDTEQYHFGFQPNEIVNVFTPNTDKINAVYYPFKDANWDEIEIAGITRSYKMTVFNRWGNKIFESDNYKIGWDGNTQDGNAVSDGVYYVQVEYVQKCEAEDYMFKVIQKVQVVR